MADKVYLHDDPVIIVEFAIAVRVPDMHKSKILNDGLKLIKHDGKSYIGISEMDILDEKIVIDMFDPTMTPEARRGWDDDDVVEKTMLEMPRWDRTFVGVPLVERRPATLKGR